MFTGDFVLPHADSVYHAPVCVYKQQVNLSDLQNEYIYGIVLALQSDADCSM